MAASSTPSRSGDSPSAKYKLAVNAYDRTSALLIALLTMVGFGVVGLCIVFFANKFTRPIEVIAFVPVEASSPTANSGLANEPEPPGAQDASELAEPQFEETLDTLTALVSNEESLLADETVDAAKDAGKGEGLGDSRQPGPGGDGVVERVPRWERWKIRWEPSSADDFSAWLDQYNIRVGVLGRDNKIHVAHKFKGGSPTVETANPSDYAAWGRAAPADGPMPALTQRLARDAGIARHGSFTLLFFPFEVEKILYTLEMEHNASKDANKVRETVFTVARGRNGYTFEVVTVSLF